MPSTATPKRSSTRTTETRGSAQQSSRNNYGHNATVAVNQYLVDAQSATPQLIQLFDELGPTEREDKDASGKPIIVKELEADAFMAYLNRLDVDFEGCGPFVVHNIVQARDFGKCTQDGFVGGWTRVMAESKGRVTADFAGQKRLVRDRIHQALADRNAFKQLYDYVFDLGREADKKALDMGLAVGFWAGLYHPAVHPWRSAHVDWLEAWTEYLREKFGVETTDAEGNVETSYKRTVSKDLWGQTRLFAAKTMEDETLGFWSEDQAWPGLIDEFVVWCREKGIAKTKTGGDSMELAD